MAQIAAEMKNYNLTLLGISETRWIQSGHCRLATWERLLYSGHEKENCTHTRSGTNAIQIARDATIGWEAHGPRIIKASFKTKHKIINTNIIQCYAPTNDAEEETKDEFYNRLQSVVENCKERDFTIMIGDLNAKAGNHNTGYDEVMGQHGLGQMNENGERLANFCAFNKLVIGGTLFQHKKNHKATLGITRSSNWRTR